MAATTTTLPEAKPRQLQIARLRREEEEETWISGEELYTEGSSDEEPQTTPLQKQSITSTKSSPATTTTTSTATSATTTTADSSTSPTTNQLLHQVLERRISAPAHFSRWQNAPKGASEPILRDEPHMTETMRRFSEMGVDLPPPFPYDRNASEGLKKVEEQEEVMLWRPKRGSLHLLRIDLDSIPSRSSTQKVTG